MIVADSGGINIPATFISEASASKILDKYQYFQGFFVEISELFAGPRISTNLLKSLI